MRDNKIKVNPINTPDTYSFESNHIFQIVQLVTKIMFCFTKFKNQNMDVMEFQERGA